MITYVGKVQSVVIDFNIMLPTTKNIVEQSIQCDKLFMLPNLENVRTQILSAPVILTMEEVFATIT